MLLEVTLGIVAVWLLIFWLRTDPPPYLGVYSQPGKWYHLKKLLFYCLLRMRQWKGKTRSQDKETESNSPTIKAAGYGLNATDFFDDMEKALKLKSDPYAVDTHYFNGLDKDGTCFILRIARRHDRQAELWLSVNVPGLGQYQCPRHPDTIIYNTKDEQINAGGLKFVCIQPMFRWKITFNGLLRKGLHNEWDDTCSKQELVHVKFSFVWEAFSESFNFDSDNAPSVLSASVAREPWTQKFWTQLQGRHQTHYEQWGEMRGVIQVQDSPPKQLILKSLRDHTYGVRDWRDFHRYIVHFGYLEDGTAFHVNTVSHPSTLSYLQCGYVSQPNALMVPMTWTDINMPMLGENLNPPTQYQFSFKAGGKTYSGELKEVWCPIYYHGVDWSTKIYEKQCTFVLNGIKGFGVTEFCYRRPDEVSVSPMAAQKSLPRLLESLNLDKVDREALALPFTSPAATSSGVVGGKGCQLAQLTQLQHQDFTVPPGFCLTLNAFKHQLEKNPLLDGLLTDLQNVCVDGNVATIQKVCDVVVNALGSLPLCGAVQQAVATQLIKLYGGEKEHDNKAFAVRSSAAGEDSDEASAAGQMDTILGVRGLKQIFEAVVKCWASQFALPAVEYRRQHGQPVWAAMGVVIQEMVDAEAAGVLFTCDPVSGNPGIMLLNANFGLGESVVSGESEPDTVEILRDADDALTIHKHTIGQKKTKILMQEEGGTVLVSVNTAEAQQCCLTDDIILRLGKLGLELERRFGDARDLEWAIADDNIYLLQARPVTTLDSETEWELIHEFDTPLASDHEVLTTANISEMMPGAVTPLTLSTFFPACEIAGQNMIKKARLQPKTYKFHKFIGICANKGFINMHYLLGMNEHRLMLNMKKMAELAVLGETREDITMEEILQHHGGALPFWTRLINSVLNIINLQGSKKSMQKHEVRLMSPELSSLDHASCEALYKDITKELAEFDKCWTDSLLNSARSGSFASILMSILSKGKPEWSQKHYSDVALLLSSCEDVFSADVPKAMQRLVASLKEEGNATKLKAMPCEDAASWLLSAESGRSGKEFSDFLKNHGHRCIKEAEFIEKSWKTQPSKVVSAIQAMLNVDIQFKKTETSVKDAIAGIKTKTTFFGSLALKWIVGKARHAVGEREWGKSLAIKMTERLKLAYWKLAEMMVAEGRLPDQELMFFFTQHEIGTLLQTRSAHLISKAQKRRRVSRKQEELVFPRIQRGHPQPLSMNRDEKALQTCIMKVTGMPVSQGVVKGTARVVTSLKDANCIQHGDVLIVPFTDVGWSPYFPLISGLVTELGGLLSHGAVVAREYGLPCIVNVDQATIIFSTGDQVLLNGTTGILEKVQ